MKTVIEIRSSGKTYTARFIDGTKETQPFGSPERALDALLDWALKDRINSIAQSGASSGCYTDVEEVFATNPAAVIGDEDMWDFGEGVAV